MANVIINDTNLTNIANAIREKNGETTKYKPSEMANAILAITTGVDTSGIPEEALTLTLECSYWDYAGRWDWFFEKYKDQMIVKEDITGAAYMFYGSKITEMPLEIYFNKYGYGFDVAGMYQQATELKSIGKIINFKPSNTDNMFSYCYNLRTIPEFENVDYSHLNDSYNFQDVDYSQMFFRCYSLRNIPSNLLQGLYNHFLTNDKAQKSVLYRGFEDCYCLDEINGIDVRVGSGAITSNLFYRTFDNCSRVKDIIFNTNNGEPFEINLSNQTISLINYVGYVNGSNTEYITDYNSGLNDDTKMVSDAYSYDTLKDNEDSWTILSEYSRYNRTSAVNTINSLPDVSTGSNNIIQFRGSSGSATDGGAINTMTEEQIAVAVAKGWTVSYT